MNKEEAEKLKKLLIAERDGKGIAGLSIIGPAPAFIHRFGFGLFKLLH